MAEDPWLTIVGLGEDGPQGLSPASQSAIDQAEVVFGAARHIALLGDVSAETQVWPVPFADGLPLLDERAGQRVAVLASGDPFWFGAGRVLAERYGPDAIRSLPGPSTFSLAAARLRWGLEKTLCLGLHAAPLAQLRPHLAPGRRIIVLLRDGDAVADLGEYLAKAGFGASDMTVLEALGGPRERVTRTSATALADGVFKHPVAAAIEVAGEGPSVPSASGLADDWFANDGQLTKRPIRAITLSTLAPRFGEHLWDIGGGSGSIAIEWCLSDPSTSASVVEMHPDRAQRIRDNAAAMGIERVTVVEATAPQGLANLAPPDAVFVGGGLTRDLIADIVSRVPAGTRLVANGVTLEAEAVLAQCQAAYGGTLMRIEIANAGPLGGKRGWQPSYPVVQWSAVL
ncbi:MAG: precorrin-6y C5,15-methyltransferase (decarboxylating) subunit CbiE [Pseudomonadota bacterium]